MSSTHIHLHCQRDMSRNINLFDIHWHLQLMLIFHEYGHRDLNICQTFTPTYRDCFLTFLDALDVLKVGEAWRKIYVSLPSFDSLVRLMIACDKSGDHVPLYAAVGGIRTLFSFWNTRDYHTLVAKWSFHLWAFGGDPKTYTRDKQ